jgi:hypothetical protein
MKKLTAVLVGLVWVGALASYAGPACSASDKTETTDKPAASCPVIGKLNLAEDQKAKVDAAQAECKKAGCTKEAMDKCMKDIEAVLTPEQLKTFKAESSKGNCTMKKECKAAEPKKD